MSPEIGAVYFSARTAFIVVLVSFNVVILIWAAGEHAYSGLIRLLYCGVLFRRAF